MKSIIIMSFITTFFAGCSAKKNADIIKQNFYDFTVVDIQGNDVNMSDYKGNVVLVVNTASKCGFTPQFEGLEALYQKYRKQGFIILGFPCNQFGSQDPGSNEGILEFCQVNYGVSFPMFSKIYVNGSKAHPLYKYLKAVLPDTLGRSIKWNFTKFLISAEGKPLKRYAPTVKPASMRKDIEAVLRAKQ